MRKITGVADRKGRISLPGFANAAVIIEAISDCEYRVRKAPENGKKPARFSEEQMPIQLSAQEGKRFLKTLQDPPRPNQAALRAVKRFKKNHG